MRRGIWGVAVLLALLLLVSAAAETPRLIAGTPHPETTSRIQLTPAPTPTPVPTPAPESTPAPEEPEETGNGPRIRPRYPAQTIQPSLPTDPPIITRAPTPTPSPTPKPTPLPTPPLVVSRADNPDAWSWFSFPKNAELMKVVMPTLYDADAALILCGGKAALIDCADYGQERDVVSMLETMGVKRLEFVLITHPHHDHTEGFGAVAAAVEVGEVLISFPEDYNERMTDLLLRAEAFKIPVRHVSDGDVLRIGEASLTLIDRVPEDYGANNRSLQAVLRYRGRSMYFSADIEPIGMDALLQNVRPGELRADILKYPHHALNNLHTGFIGAVRPKLCVITSRSNDTASKRALRDNQIPYINTRTGGVILSTDGRHWLVERLIPGWRLDY